MSGHSKWSSIKRQKAVTDTKRGQAFTKCANAITIAVREGGGVDPASNFKLRLTIDQARALNMPKDNIQRAIERGAGKGEGAIIETVSYEGYAPGKVALIIEAVTDNKNRTTPEIRGTIERAGGTFASVGAVSWMFCEQGLITVEKKSKTIDEIFEIAVESGAEEVEDTDEVVEIYTKPNEIEKIKNTLIDKGLNVASAELFKKPTTTQKVEDVNTASKILKLIDKLEDLDSVQKVYANFDIDDEVLQKVQTA
ncbi:transcriptional regulator [Candidatus Curtissbacteria bacterium RBG_13_35_7]|uniref:Probable transcriptional regulatory protein A2164_04345 n=1 Tax=Candidatus Curtissbacteria bacterium RBG_13_35_7 TaxID=1797705 RepID=A0A1F5G5Y0_9BACT|nr:MAG: transcriptional regulator [Candidatus Curtissbacteria bacterium RBG_13_35_7]